MAERKRGKFAQKAKTMFDQEKLTGLADFLDDESEGSSRKSVTTENRTTVQSENHIDAKRQGKVREEFRLPEDLAETLRDYAYHNRRKKTAVVIEALSEFFRNKNFPSP